MIIRSLYRLASSSLITALLLLGSIPQPVAAKKDGPTITSTKFDKALENVFYFDDSNIILGQDRDAKTIWRSADAGETWKKVNDDKQAGAALDLWAHPYDNQRAYIIGTSKQHWMTTDQGKTWNSFKTESGLGYRSDPLRFHGTDPKKVIWNGDVCDGMFCEPSISYTDDDFESIHDLSPKARGCYWAIGTPTFGVGKSSLKNRVFCVVQGLYSDKGRDQRLVYSDNYFKNEGIEPELDEGRAVSGIISMAQVKAYLVAAAKSAGTNELALYVTIDGEQWHRAEFGQHRVEEDAYTILESTDYSVQVDVLGSKKNNPMGYLFTSNSNGTYFTRNIDHTNRNMNGRVDFEQIAGINGIVLVNVVDNWKEVETSVIADKVIQSRISFDDGRTFSDLMVGEKKLHLHSVTDARQNGRIFSSPAPGIVMGVGNTGTSLRAYEDGDLFVSDDAGFTWREALNGAHLYEFGNRGAVIVAIDDEDTTSHLQYSIDHGKTWVKADLDIKIRAKFLTTVPDSTTLKFLLMGTHGTGSKTEWHVFKIDFEGLHERACKKDDFEKWPARVDKDGKPTCLMGAKQFYQRRKADADCFIEERDFEDPHSEDEICACTKADYECDSNFVRDPEDRSICKPVASLGIPKDVCKSEKDTFKGPSGWRLIPGNNCTKEGGVDLAKEIERPCSDAAKKPVATGDIGVEKTNFNADRFAEWYYLEKGSNSKGDDETIVMRTTEQEIYITRDHGKTWAPILKGEPITAIMPNPNFYEAIYFLTGSKTVHYTIDRGEKFRTFSAPDSPSKLNLPTLRFHPENEDWFLWSSAVGRDKSQTDISFSDDRGDHWKTLVRGARKCDFIPKEGSGRADQLIYCEQYENENPEKNLMLLSSDDFFAKHTVHFNDILDFATMSEFIIVAQRTEDRTGLKVDASVDGQVFAAAQFPRDFHVDVQSAYTVLDSSTHAVFLHVTVETAEDRQYGTIIKSNSNGTSYVLTQRAVNRDNSGYVDFEKMQGLEGVAMINVVANVEEVKGGTKKKLKSKITHNDGAVWALMPPPKKDAVGNDYKCVSDDNKATEKCSLHIHSYTERSDKSATFSSPSAVGMMMAVGNVGEYLTRKDDESTDTFITRDAGITWKSVKKGSYMWEYGDQGSVIVIVEESKPTKSIFYTLDEGNTWTEFEFSPKVEMQIDAITTLPSDTSMKFLLWGREVGQGAAKGIFTVNLDFSSLKERQRACDLDEDKPVNDDYELWEPKHPMQDQNCLFGHIAQYHRKKLSADCYNGKKITHLHKILRNCTCSREDFECDYNYEMKADGTCGLVPGLKEQDHEEKCRKNPDQVEFFYGSGYRRIPLTTCEGGQELDKVHSKPCPGHENEYQKKHGLSGIGLFFVVVVAFAAAAGVGYWVYTRWMSQGFGSFGAIRLGDGGPSGESPWISIPVAIISGIVAVARATPLLMMSLWRSARGYMPVGGGRGGGRFGAASGPYRSRDAFASRRQDYSQVVEDDELLGDGLDEEDEV